MYIVDIDDKDDQLMRQQTDETPANYIQNFLTPASATTPGGTMVQGIKAELAEANKASGSVVDTIVQQTIINSQRP